MKHLHHDHHHRHNQWKNTVRLVAKRIGFASLIGVLACGALTVQRVNAGSTTTQPTTTQPAGLVLFPETWGLIWTTSSVTGLSIQKIIVDLGSGESLNTIAGSDAATITADVETAYSNRLTAAVNAGIITQAVATADESAFDATAAAIMADSGTVLGFHTPPAKPVPTLVKTKKVHHKAAPVYVHGNRALVGALISTSAGVTGVSVPTITADLQTGESLDTIDGSSSATVAADVVAAFTDNATDAVHTGCMLSMSMKATAPSSTVLAAEVTALMAEPGTVLLGGATHPTSPKPLGYAGQHGPSGSTQTYARVSGVAHAGGQSGHGFQSGGSDRFSGQGGFSQGAHGGGFGR